MCKMIIIGGTAKYTNVTLGNCLPSVSYVVNLPNIPVVVGGAIIQLPKYKPPENTVVLEVLPGPN